MARSVLGHMFSAVLAAVLVVHEHFCVLCKVV
jgi:hypothetical protein